MNDDLEKQQNETQQIQEELSGKGLSRRGFVDRVKALGVGFGAAFMLGVKGADAHNATENALNIESTNPALDTIIKEGRKEHKGDAEGEVIQTAWYRRFYARGYRRFYRRFYARGYRRFYRRF
jgi:hypothetical protein